MDEFETLRNLPERARQWMESEGEDGPGLLPFLSALRACEETPGDYDLVRELATSDYGDLSGVEITNDVLAKTFGPAWRGVVRMVRRCAVLTGEYATSMSFASARTKDIADVARTVVPQAVAAMETAIVRRVSAGSLAADAVVDAVAAVTALAAGAISPSEFDRLTGPWLRVVGPTWEKPRTTG
jgi:hypothetical protein